MTRDAPDGDENPNTVAPIRATGALADPDPLLAELNVVRIEGRYFSFDKHVAKTNTGIYEYCDDGRGIVIETNPRYGQPSIVAYKVLQAVFRKITLAGKPYHDTVTFSYREHATPRISTPPSASCRTPRSSCTSMTRRTASASGSAVAGSSSSAAPV